MSKRRLPQIALRRSIAAITLAALALAAAAPVRAESSAEARADLARQHANAERDLYNMYEQRKFRSMGGRKSLPKRMRMYELIQQQQFEQRLLQSDQIRRLGRYNFHDRSPQQQLRRFQSESTQQLLRFYNQP